MTTTNNRNHPDADDWRRDIVEEPASDDVLAKMTAERDAAVASWKQARSDATRSHMDWQRDCAGKHAALRSLTTALAERDALREALKAAEPYVEVLHSTLPDKGSRKAVWKVIEQMRATLALATKEPRP